LCTDKFLHENIALKHVKEMALANQVQLTFRTSHFLHGRGQDNDSHFLDGYLCTCLWYRHFLEHTGSILDSCWNLQIVKEHRLTGCVVGVGA
jgi:hypothetical protein